MVIDDSFGWYTGTVDTAVSGAAVCSFAVLVQPVKYKMAVSSSADVKDLVLTGL
jgi:hypothetical protein